MSDDGSRLLASLSSCMGGWCEQRDTCARHTTAPRSVAHERICAKGQERPEPLIDLTTFADPVYPEAVRALEKRRASLVARTRALPPPKMTQGIRTDGVRTAADLMLRCTVDEHSKCWHWKAARDSQGRPSVWLPAIRAVGSIGVACAVFATGKRPERGTAWHAICTTPHCANPAHRVCGTRSSQMLALKMTRTPLQIARVTAGKRARAKLTQADVQSIRAGSMTLKQIVAAHGISIGYACEIRSGKRRADLAAPSSSVFAWRPAA